jgi:MoxR-like ATPase
LKIISKYDILYGNNLMERGNMENYQECLQKIQDEVNSIIKGKESIVRKVLAAILAEGHILMEDIPGVGKTTLATTFAKALSLDYHRVQFTPDVLPSDLLGFSMYNSKTNDFEFRNGSIFCNLFLADEINRTSPKTQSALLEVMEERQASVEGQTRKLPSPFIVIATQNPSGSSGTQNLPESQMDRFMICISMGYPAHSDALSILKNEVWTHLDSVKSVVTLEEIKELQAAAEKVYMHEELYDYIISIVETTRINELFSSGASPRASIAMLRMARAIALINGRDFVTAEDIQNVAQDVLGHRVKISTRAKAEGRNMNDCISAMIRTVKVPRNS